jgi:molybdate transport system substrate-binding protein
LGVAVQKGATKPDISTAAALKQTLLNAKSIVAVDPAQGSAGAITLAALDKLGITDQVKPKLKLVQGAGQVQQAVAKGEVEIAVGPYLSEMHDPGIDPIGVIPTDVSTPVDITGFLSTSAKDSKAAKMLLDYLSSHEVASIYEEAKIFPAH